MATRFGAKPDEVLKFEGDAIASMKVDPDPSRFAAPPIDPAFCAVLAKEGQQQPGLIRKGTEGEPVLFVGRRRRAHILHINEDPAAWGLDAPMVFMAKFKPVTAEAAAAMAASENLEQAQLTALDKAFIAQGMKLRDADDSAIAARLRISKTRVTQLLDLFALGDGVLSLIHAKKLTEAGARGLMGLSADVIADVAAKINGGSKAHAILAEIREQHRKKGNARPRSGRDMIKAFDDLGGDAGATLKAWATGDTTVGDLATVLKGLGVRA